MTEPSTPPGPSSGGLLSSTRSLLGTLLDIFHTRLELISAELEEEKLRLLKVLAWGAMALMLGGMGLLFASTFIVLLFWEEYRLLAVGAMASLFTVACVVAAARVGVHLKASAALLSDTLAELKQDHRALMSSVSDAEKG